eukprot:10152696-Alexandrium_andersonii.AAC.1
MGHGHAGSRPCCPGLGRASARARTWCVFVSSPCGESCTAGARTCCDAAPWWFAGRQRSSPPRPD